jgi:N-lysine methyltransferase SETD6
MLTSVKSLTTLMMSEAKGEDSMWSPYLAILPSKLDSLVFWSLSELAELQSSVVLNKIGKADAEALFHQKVETLGLANFTIELFHQMASTIMAYAFDIPEEDPRSDLESEKGEDLVDDEDETTILTMIPLADMLNADAERNNARLVWDNEDLEMRSIKKIKEGEEIFNDYGLLPRSDLLRRYGYITDNYTTYDVTELSTKSIISAFQTGLVLDDESKPFELDNADLETRLELARREDVYEDSYDINHASSERPCLPDELIAFIYLLIIDEKTLASILTSESGIPSRSKMTTELLGLVMRRLLTLREQEYATSLEEDDALLKTGVSSSRKEMAVKVRRGEKAVLREAMTEAASFQGANKRMRWNNLNRGVFEEVPNPPKRTKVR